MSTDSKSIVAAVVLVVSSMACAPQSNATSERPIAGAVAEPRIESTSSPDRPVAEPGTEPTGMPTSASASPRSDAAGIAPGTYEMKLQLTDDTCGGLPVAITREVMIEVGAPHTLVLRFRNPSATWSCSDEGVAVTCIGEDVLPGPTSTARRTTRREARLIPADHGFTGTLRSTSSCDGSSCGPTPRDVGCSWGYQATGRRDAW